MDSAKQQTTNTPSAQEILKSATTLFQQENYSQAESLFTQLLTLQPTNHEFILKRGLCRLQTHRPSEAHQDFKNALLIRQDIPDAWTGLGCIYQDYNRFPEAIQAFSETLKYTPNNLAVLGKRSLCYSAINEHQKAIDDCTKIIGHDPSNYNAYVNRGVEYKKLNQFDKAIGDYSEAITLHPEEPVAYYNRGSCYKLLDQPLNAEADILIARSLYKTKEDLDDCDKQLKVITEMKAKMEAQRASVALASTPMQIDSTSTSQRSTESAPPIASAITASSHAITGSTPSSTISSSAPATSSTAVSELTYQALTTLQEAVVVRTEADYLKACASLPLELQKTRPRFWNNKDVMKWVSNLGKHFTSAETEQFRAQMAKFKVDGLLLLQLTRENLDELHLTGELARQRFLLGISSLKAIDDYDCKREAKKFAEVKKKRRELESQQRPSMT